MEGKREGKKRKRASYGFLLGTSYLFQEELSFGDLKIEDYQAVAMDLTNINASYEMIKLPPIDGVLGGDLLRKHNAVISYKLKKIRLFPTK